MLVVSAIVSSIETSITGADFVKIETLADKGNVRAKKALKFNDKEQKIISTMLFLNNTVKNNTIKANTIADSTEYTITYKVDNKVYKTQKYKLGTKSP